MTRFIDSSFIVVIITGFLYSVSSAHYYGYLNHIGVEPDMIVRSAHQTLYYGVFVIMPPIIKASIYIIGLIFIIILLAYLYAQVMSGLSIKTRRRLIKIKKNLKPKPMKKVEKNALLISKKIIILSLIPLALFYSLYQAEQNGISSGKEFLDKLNKNNLNEKMLVKQYIGAKETYLFPITCGINTCVFVDIKIKGFHFIENKGSPIKNVTSQAIRTEALRTPASS